MAFELELPEPLKGQRWKVKIRDKERAEPPHVTVLWKTQSWRVGLRDLAFLDREPDPGEVPAAILSTIKEKLEELRAQWDHMYPDNPVSSEIENDADRTKG
jgi:hypothetical protein